MLAAHTVDSQISVIRRSGELTTGTGSYPLPSSTSPLAGGSGTGGPARYPTIITSLCAELCGCVLFRSCCTHLCCVFFMFFAFWRLCHGWESVCSCLSCSSLRRGNIFFTSAATASVIHPSLCYIFKGEYKELGEILPGVRSFSLMFGAFTFMCQ